VSFTVSSPALPYPLAEPAWSLTFLHERLDDGSMALALPVFDLTGRRWLDCPIQDAFDPMALTERLDAIIRLFGLPQSIMLCDALEYPVVSVIEWGELRGINVLSAGTGSWLNMPFLPVPSGRIWSSSAEAETTIDGWRTTYDELRYPFGEPPPVSRVMDLLASSRPS
jgi:hypothetical protein